MAKQLVKTFIKRGQEIKKENLKPSGIYAVRYALPAELAAQFNTVQEQWGLVQLDSFGQIIRTWNVDDYNVLSSTEVHQPWFEHMTYFRSSQLERQFIEYYDKWLSDHVYYSLKLGEVNSKITYIEESYRIKLNHPMHRFADFVIRIINKIKK